MRRKDKEVTDETLIATVLAEATICHLGMVDEGRPYVVAMNFGVGENCLYFHSAAEGRKIDILRRNPQVCFQMETRTEPVSGPNACNYSMQYLSVVGYGMASFVEDADDKRRALDGIMRKYSNRETWAYAEGSVREIAIIRVEITEISGKKSKLDAKGNPL